MERIRELAEMIREALNALGHAATPMTFDATFCGNIHLLLTRWPGERSG